MSGIHLKIPAHADHIDIVRLCLSGISSNSGFSYEDIEDMKIAVAEACNNAVLYGYLDGSEGFIDIWFDIDETSITIKVKDSGLSFDYTVAADKASPYMNERVSNLRVGGLGIYLMQALMDEVTISTEMGTEVVMTKYIQ